MHTSNNRVLSYKLSPVEECLKKAIKSQLVADVPVGIFLSGGVDSTLILAICKELGWKHLPTFTITYPESDKSFGTEDYHYARKAARLYESEHHEVEITDKILDKLPDYIQSLGQPFTDGASLLTFYLSQYAKNHVKVALSGIGADELFAGYNRHWAFAKYLKYYNFWKMTAPFFKKMTWLFPDGFSHPFRKQFRLAKKFIIHIDKNPTQTFLNFVYGTHIGKDISTSLQIDSLKDALIYDQTHFLKKLLLLTDNASMQHSLEVRVPYLDNALLEWARKTPADFLLKHGRKWILKELLNQRRGQVFTKRKKEGFGVPLGYWLRQKKYRYLFEGLLNKNSPAFDYLDFKKTQKLLKGHFRQKADYSQAVWALLVWEMWYAYRSNR